MGIIGLMIIAVLGLVVITTLFSSIKIVSTGNVYIVEKLGVYSRTLEPGVHFLIPFIENVVSKVSLKRQILDAEPQAVITKDNVSVLVDTITQYTILDAKASKYNIEDYRKGIYYTTLTTMRSVIGDMTLDELLSGRESINKKILEIVDLETDAYGVKIISSEIKNIQPPQNILHSMEQLMTSKKDKEAKITKAEGDKISAIETAEGEKKSAILRAEADRESKILKAQADKEYAILQAEGKQKAILLEAEADGQATRIRAEAEAEAIREINKAIKESGTDEKVIALKQIEGFIEMSKNPANKLILPAEHMGTLGNISAIAESLNLSKDK